MPRKNKQYSKEVLGVAVEEVKAGASLRKTAQKYGNVIPHTTLADYKKNTYSHNPHPNSALTPAEEEALLSFIFWMVDHGFPITRSLVKVLAIGIIRESGRSNTTRVNLEKGPSDMWWSRFKAHHPALTMRTADSLDRARVHGATPEAIEGFFSIYEALYIQHDVKNKPHLMFNCDETGFGDKPRSREKVLCQTGRRHIYQQQQTTRQHITVHCCVVRILPSAEGTDATPATSSPMPSSTPTTPPAIATPSSTPTTASATPSSASTTSASASAPLTGTNMSATPSATPAPCPTCKRVTPKNYLVAAGIIPESLANILMSPALEKQDKVRRRLPLPARVITSDEYFNLGAQKEAEEKEKEDKKKKRKEDKAKKKEERRQAQEERRQVQEAKRQRKQAPPPAEQDGEHCAICRCLVPPGSADDTVDEWVQCEICQLWFHLQCAEVPDTEWLCMKCCLHP
ncbi:hypothetical protein SKAU_G00096420 [Synaphobranchus kaupii]|uniref:HTH CENPB-type domain-containing protein n=1 Tax=Synaphobranchus kaupii TaxID=118154 RepID=A0A9Q1FYA5_SYNKA|nr:hypothetical protein SKAU_G00096420 [Synaphobranchus kaupii]